MIHLIWGAMFSGKTSELLHYLSTSIIRNMDTILIRPDIDNRDFLSRLTNKKFETIRTMKLDYQFYKNVKKYKVLGIDELHLFQEIKKSFIEQCLDNNKIIYVTALNGDINNDIFPNVSKIIPYVTKYEFRKSVCPDCFDNGIYHVKKPGIKESVGNDIYQVKCWKHRNKF